MEAMNAHAATLLFEEFAEWSDSLAACFVMVTSGREAVRTNVLKSRVVSASLSVT
jgi:hypothetical protein